MVSWWVKNPEPKPRTRPHAKRIATTGGQFIINYEGLLHFVCGLIAYRAAGLFG